MYSAKKKACLHSGLSLEISGPATDVTSDDGDQTCQRSVVKAKDRKVYCMSRLTESSFTDPFAVIVVRIGETGDAARRVLDVVSRQDAASPVAIVVFVPVSTQEGSERLKQLLADLHDAARDLSPNQRLLTVPCSDQGERCAVDDTTPDCLSFYCDVAGDDWFEFWLGGVQFIALNSLLDEDSSMEQVEWLIAKLMQRQHEHMARVVLICDSFASIRRHYETAELPITADGALLVPSLLSSSISHVIECCVDPCDQDVSGRSVVPMTTDSDSTALVVSFTQNSIRPITCVAADLSENLVMNM